ncbi:hypothetical protein QBC39DRAFT_357948 [Podospora conica]|nr:hypothetical protein QBC39DRAFT_357948 [Schizothecium conicum]
MSSPTNSAEAGSAEESHFSEADRKFLEMAFTCLKTPPELDIQKLGEKLGVKPKTVTNRWCDLKKKLFANEGLSAEGGAPRTPVKKRKTAEVQGGSATKKVAKPRATKKKVEPKEENSDQGV